MKGSNFFICVLFGVGVVGGDVFDFMCEVFIKFETWE
jgi:hypothetical protein